MTTLAADANRVYEIGDVQEYPVIATDILYGDAAIGLVAASGNARPLTSADLFVGFAERQTDNASGAAGDKTIRVRKRGVVKLSVAGAVATDVLQPVYATDDNAFSFSPVGGVFVGFVERFVSSGVVMVAFDVDGFRDPHAGLLAELHSTNFTVDVQDAGKVIVIDTDGVVVTLPATAAGGGRVRFLNIGAYAAVGFSLSPNASDKVQGPDIAGTDNKDLINTKATARRGDFVDLVFGQADGPCVAAMRGVWATEG